MNKLIASDAERAVLGACINNTKHISTIINNNLIPTDDAWNAHKEIWIALKEMYYRGIEINPISINDYQIRVMKIDRIGIQFLEDIAEQSKKYTIDIKYLCTIIWDRYLRRKSVEIGNEIISASYKDYERLKTMLINHQMNIQKLEQLDTRKSDTISTVVEDAKNEIKTGGKIIKFGIKFLDNSSGGMTRGELTSLGGRPGNGKTTLMLNIIRALVKNYKVLLVNREMTNSSAISKLMVMDSNKLYNDLLREYPMSDIVKREIDNMAEVIKDKYKNLIMFDNIKTLSGSIMAIRKYKPDIFIDDYIQEIIIEEKMERRFQIEKIMRDYKWIAKETNSCGILLSQIKRIEDRIDPIPTMGDYSEGATIEHASETCSFIHYPYLINSEENNANTSMFIVKKARYGKIGTYNVGFRGDKGLYFETPQKAIESYG